MTEVPITEATYQALVEGRFDNELEVLVRLIKQRYKVLRTEREHKMRRHLEIGDSVVLGAIKPKLYQGAVCEVIDIEATQVRVKLKHSVGVGSTYRREGTIILVRPACIMSISRDGRIIL